MKRLIHILFGLSICLSLRAGDLVRNITLNDGQTLSASDLHNLIDLTSISTSWFSSKPNDPLLLPSDLLLIYSPSLNGYYKATVSTFLYNNAGFITNATFLSAAATNDSLLIFDYSSGTLANVNPIGLVAPTLPFDFTYFTNSAPSTSFYIYGLEGTTLNGSSIPTAGSNAAYTVYNVGQKWLSISSPTNLAVDTTITNSDTIVLWHSTDGTNYTAGRSTLEGLFTNSTPLTVTNTALTNVPNTTYPTNLLFLALQQNWGTNGVLSNNVVGTFDLISIKNFLTNYFARLTNTPATSFTSILYSLSGGITANTNHSLGGMPTICQWRLVCQTNDAGYAVGDEIPVEAVFGISGGNGNLVFAGGANSTNVFLTYNTAVSFLLVNKASASAISATAVRWKARAYARP